MFFVLESIEIRLMVIMIIVKLDCFKSGCIRKCLIKCVKIDDLMIV